MIHIACCFDRRFEILFVVLAHSIARHTRAPVTIHALHDGPTPLAMRHAPRSATLRVEFQDIGARYEKIEVNGPQSVVTYARFVLPDILAGIDRVLYLDVDMLTRRDLAPLYETDMGGKALGAEKSGGDSAVGWHGVPPLSLVGWVHDAGIRRQTEWQIMRCFRQFPDTMKATSSEMTTWTPSTPN